MLEIETTVIEMKNVFDGLSSRLDIAEERISLVYLFLKDFIYLLMRDTHRERQRHRQREEQAPRREPDLGLDPGTPGSRPGPTAALNR